MRLIPLIVLLFFSNVIFGQSTCNSAKEISASQFNNIKLNGKTQFFRIQKDSTFASLLLKGDFENVIVFQSDDCSTLIVKSVLNNLGIYNF